MCDISNCTFQYKKKMMTFRTELFCFKTVVFRSDITKAVRFSFFNRNGLPIYLITSKIHQV